MKILHCCLAAFYIDNFSYQENILPRIHQNQGNNVKIVASTETYLKNLELGYLKASTYANIDGIEVTRINYNKWIPKVLVRKLRLYSGLSKIILEYKPDIIFIHDCQFLSILSIAKYAKNNSVKIYVDCHADFVNSGKNWISKNILHKIIYRFCAQRISKYVTTFFGTLPLRETFLHEVYGISKDKIQLLPFGFDDTNFDFNQFSEIRSIMRNKLLLKENDFVIITGGKIDKRKNIHTLIEAFRDINFQKKHPNTKLIVFGKPVKELDNIINKLIDYKDIRYIDWIPSDEIPNYFIASDLAFFPGTHSVLWEVAVGLGIPAVFRKWEGIQHYDLGGNCIYLENSNVLHIVEILTKIIGDQNNYKIMKNAAQIFGPEKFIYSKIANKSIGVTN